MNLHKHGITTEGSNIRIHVCPKINTIYWFTRYAIIQCIETHKYKMVNGYDGNGNNSAYGYLVPPHDILDIISIYNSYVFTIYQFNDNMTEKEKGCVAERLVLYLLLNEYIVKCNKAELITDVKTQINYGDILVDDCVYIEVKCDYIGGEIREGYSKTTGNLFIQTEERNYQGKTS